MAEIYSGVVVVTGGEEGFPTQAVLVVGVMHVKAGTPAAMALPANGGRPIPLYEGDEALAWRVVKAVEHALIDHKTVLYVRDALMPGVGG